MYKWASFHSYVNLSEVHRLFSQIRHFEKPTGTTWYYPTRFPQKVDDRKSQQIRLLHIFFAILINLGNPTIPSP